MSRKWTVPKISKGEDWYVWYRFLNPATGKPQMFKLRMGLNRVKSLRDRNTLAKRIKEAQTELLISGFNPFATKEELINKDIPDVLNSMAFSDALIWAFNKRERDKKKKPLAHSTVNDRLSTIKIIKEGAEAIGRNKRITDIKRADIEAILDHIQVKRNLGNARYNFIRETIHSLLVYCVKADIIPSNPCSAVDVLPRIKKSKVHSPPTPKELSIIATFLKEQNFAFYVYNKIIYQTGMREKEILSLKPASIDVEGLGIYLEETSAKDSEERYVAVNAELMTDILTLLDTCKRGHYIFSYGNTKHGWHMSDMFKSGPKLMHRNKASEYWRRLVKDPKEGLGINRTMYSQKKAGANKKLDGGVTVREIGEGFGHSDERTTLIYLTEHDRLRNDKLRKLDLPYE